MFVVERRLVWMVCTGLLGWDWRPVAGAVDTTVGCWLGNVLTRRMSPSFWRGSVIFGVTCASCRSVSYTESLTVCCEILVWAIQSIPSNSALASLNANHFALNVAHSAAEGAMCMPLHNLISKITLYCNAIALQLSHGLQCLRTLRSIFPPQFNFLRDVAKSFCSTVFCRKEPTSLQHAASRHATAVWQPHSDTRTSLRSNKVSLKLPVVVCGEKWMNCRHGRQSEKGRGTLYTVCGRERLTFSKLAEFITPPDRFTLPYGFFYPCLSSTFSSSGYLSHV